MNDLTPVLVRIILRYLSGALIALGGMWAALGEGIVASPQVEALLTTILGAILGAATEWLYAKARVTGGPT